MRNDSVTLGTTPSQGALLIVTGPRIWTPAQGDSGLIVLARTPPLAVVVGGRIFTRDVQAGWEGDLGHESGVHERRRHQVTLGVPVIGSNSRQKEPTRVIGHPDLASGASVQRGESLYVSVAEAIYRESRGEEVEIHLSPTAEDAEALSDLRTRARNRWESDRLPDGWTRPLPPPQKPMFTPSPKEKSIAGELPDDLRALADRFRVLSSEKDE